MEEPEEYNEDSLTDAERIQIELAMLDIAYDNAYSLLTEQMTFEDLLTDKARFGFSAIMAYDPVDGPTREDLENMIEYYIDMDESEMYLRCAKLKKILHEKFPDSVITSID